MRMRSIAIAVSWVTAAATVGVGGLVAVRAGFIDLPLALMVSFGVVHLILMWRDVLVAALRMATAELAIATLLLLLTIFPAYGSTPPYSGLTVTQMVLIWMAGGSVFLTLAWVCMQVARTESTPTSSRPSQ